MSEKSRPAVLTCAELSRDDIRSLLAGYGLERVDHPAGHALPGSYWGDSEAGLVGREVHVHPDTPAHSLLHETCHYLCMDPDRRAGLDTDAGGDYDEENAVCYLQILLADRLPGFGRDRCMADMDTWGYTFRLGSARAWFEYDAGDAAAWLAGHGLIDERGRPTRNIRTR